MKVLFTVFALFFFVFNSLNSQHLQIEQHDKKLELVIPLPGISVHFPTGLIYEDISGNAFSNLSDDAITIGDGPVGFSITANNTQYARMTKNSFSVNWIQGNEDLTFVGPLQPVYWGPRLGPNTFDYELRTYGSISTFNFINETLTELGQSGGTGALRLTRPSAGTVHTLTIDNTGNPSWTAVSDRRVKNSIKNTEPLLQKLTSLQLKNYKYNGSDVVTTGYIAQEVRSVFPHLVTEQEDGYLAINYLGFITLAVQAIKEQQDVIGDLEERLEKLEKLLMDDIR